MTYRQCTPRAFSCFRHVLSERRQVQLVVAAPLVPFVLLASVARRVVRARSHVLSFLTALGALLVLASAWAAGEAIGAFLTEGEMREALRAA
jgi:hypothetical protein